MRDKSYEELENAERRRFLTLLAVSSGACALIGLGTGFLLGLKKGISLDYSEGEKKGREEGLREGREKGNIEGADKANKDLVESIDHEFIFNSAFLLENKLDYKKEKDALSSVNFISDENDKSGHSIDSLFKNSVMLSNVFFPTLSIENIIYKLWEFKGRKKDIKPRIWYSNGWSNGFLLSSGGHILTALHVVKDKKFHDYHKLVVMNENKNVFDVAGVLAYSEKYDLALLKSDLKVKDISPITLLSEKALNEGIKIYNIGRVVNESVNYKFNKDSFKIKNKQGIKLERYTSTGYYKGFKPRITFSEDGQVILSSAVLTDRFSRGGYSGSVIADRKGRIIGVHSLNDGLISYASPASKINELIKFYLSSLEKE